MRKNAPRAAFPFAAVVGVFLFIHSSLIAESPEYGYLRWVTAIDGLRVRDAGSLTGAKVASLPFCAPCLALETGSSEKIDGIEGAWIRVRSGHAIGWVFGGYLGNRPPVGRAFGDRVIERARIEKPTFYQEKKLTRQMIADRWFVEYSDGEPVSPDGSGDSALENFDPYTGDLGRCYEFGSDGSCGCGIADSDSWMGGTYVLDGNAARCRFKICPDDDGGSDQAPRSIEYRYTLNAVDSTHLDVTDEDGHWYRCARAGSAVADSLADLSGRSFVEFVRSHGYGAGTTFSTGETLLMIAVKARNPAAVEWLAESLRCDVNARSRVGLTALHYAAANGSGEATLKILQRLIELGADVNAVDDYGETPLDRTLHGRHHELNDRTFRDALRAAGAVSSRKDWADLMTDFDRD